MPFDPTQPANHSSLSSQVMRSQLNGLKALIDAIVTLTDAQIDGVTTLLPGDPATVGLTVSGDTLHFSFGIPQGDEGPQGIQGPPFAAAVIDSVTSLPPADVATVSVTFDGTNVHFSFGIPRGQTGDPGNNGTDGAPGPQGPQGLPGEVTLAQLTAAINGTSANSNGVALLGLVVSDPPSQAEMQSLADKVDELITAMRR